MKKWNSPSLTKLGIENTQAKPGAETCPECSHAVTPGNPNNSNHTGWCTIGNVSGGNPDIPTS